MEPYFFILLFFGAIYLLGIILVVVTAGKNLPPLRRISITLRINLVIFLLGCAMTSVAILFDFNYLNYESPIPYSNWKQIRFTDFRGLKRPGQSLDGMNEFAFIVGEMQVTRNDKAITATTYFFPSRSYVYNSNLENDYLLAHELNHLHITEYCARLFRKEIKAASKSVPDDTIEIIKTRFRKYDDSLQFAYDDQTYHSYVLGKQKAWERTIDSCLKSLSEYENPVITNR